LTRYAIRYRNPRQVDEAGIILVPRGLQIATERARLEGCGYVVIGIDAYSATYAEAILRDAPAAANVQHPFGVE